MASGHSQIGGKMSTELYICVKNFDFLMLCIRFMRRQNRGALGFSGIMKTPAILNTTQSMGEVYSNTDLVKIACL